MHEEVDDLVVEVLLLERDEVLPAEIQWFHFFYTSSVIISLEFVFLYLRLTVGEDLLPVSVQESPNLCMFKFLFLTCFNNGFPRSFGHGRRRLTNRQAFSLGVIDMFSVCIIKHLLERGIT